VNHNKLRKQTQVVIYSHLITQSINHMFHNSQQNYTYFTFRKNSWQTHFLNETSYDFRCARGHRLV